MRTGGDRGRKEDHLEGCSQSDCNESWCRDSLDAWNDVTQHAKQKLFVSSHLPVGLTSFFISSRRGPDFSSRCWLDFTRGEQGKKKIASLTRLSHWVSHPECEAAHMRAQAPPPEQLSGRVSAQGLFPWKSAVKGRLCHNIEWMPVPIWQLRVHPSNTASVQPIARIHWYDATRPPRIKLSEIC